MRKVGRSNRNPVEDMRVAAKQVAITLAAVAFIVGLVIGAVIVWIF